MKTRSIARGIVGSVAALLGVMAAGCSAETGAPDEAAEIGSTSAALTAVKTGTDNPADLTDGTGGTTDIRAGFASACVLQATVNNVTKDYLIRAGGFTNGASATKQIVVFSKGNSPAIQSGATHELTVASGSGQMVKLNATQCAYVGGSSADGGGTATANVDVLTLSFSGSTPVVTVSNKTSLNAARSNFVLTTCTDNSSGVHLVAIGGKSGSSYLQSIEIANTALSSWASSASALATGRMNLGADIDDSRHIFAAGGEVTGGSRSASVDLIRLGTDCSFTDTNPSTTGLPHAADGLVVHFDATSGEFISTAGTFLSSMVPTLETTERHYTVTWTGTPDVTSSSDTSSPTNFNGTFRPYVVRKNATDIFLIGGANAAINASIAKVQKYATSSTWTSQSTTSSVGIYGGVGGYLPNASEVWAMDGYSTAPSTIGVLVDAFGE